MANLRLPHTTVKKQRREHGLSQTPEWRAWKGLKERCLNPDRKDFHHYGGRGITFCEQWQEFENFYADMGPRPSPKHSIDRIDNDGPYSPENCRWATRSEQVANRRRITHCKHGHEYTAENTAYFLTNGKPQRHCRICCRRNALRSKWRKINPDDPRAHL